MHARRRSIIQMIPVQIAPDLGSQWALERADGCCSARQITAPATFLLVSFHLSIYFDPLRWNICIYKLASTPPPTSSIPRTNGWTSQQRFRKWDDHNGQASRSSSRFKVDLSRGTSIHSHSVNGMSRNDQITGLTISSDTVWLNVYTLRPKNILEVCVYLM